MQLLYTHITAYQFHDGDAHRTTHLYLQSFVLGRDKDREADYLSADICNNWN